ncbi:hypothetical protein WJX77_011112 [Trebouxia sp. C0004]
MAVMLETSKGDMVIDLFTDDCPLTTKNFLKLCKIKYYNNVLFHNVQSNFIAQTGDPTGTGRGGDSVYGLMHGDQARFFADEVREHLKHKTKGMVAMASGGKETNASQFYITTGLELDSLDGKHTIFGEVSEGLDVLQQIDEAFVDDAGRPLQNIRHTHVLDDPFDDPPELATLIPEASPPPTFERGDRLEDDWKPTEDTRAPEVIEEEIRRSEAQNRAVVLEMIGDLPEADSKPPSNMLFIAKLNQVTTEEDLETIFGRFGNITSCDIIKDKKTGDSLCYAFLGYDNDTSCEDAYDKMNNVLIDDRRIKVDFSQSVYHLWKQFRRFGKDSGAPDPSQQGLNAQPGAIGGHDRLQLKSTGRGLGNQRYNLLLDQEEAPSQSKAKGSHRHRDAGKLPKRQRPDTTGEPFQARPTRDQPSGRQDEPLQHSGHKRSRHDPSRSTDMHPDRHEDRHQNNGHNGGSRKHSDSYHEGDERVHRYGERGREDSRSQREHTDPAYTGGNERQPSDRAEAYESRSHWDNQSGHGHRDWNSRDMYDRRHDRSHKSSRQDAHRH